MLAVVKTPLRLRTFPGYGYFLAQGYTTWPENWNTSVIHSHRGPVIPNSKMHGCYNGIGLCRYFDGKYELALEHFKKALTEDPHNASAILRSADAFGVQRVHIIPAPSGFHVSRPISKNAHRWLELKRHDAAEACADALEADGYRIYVASMEGTVTPRELSRESKVAVVFGNEHSGPSPAMRARAAGTYAIPMSGFVESLNVSVAAAITLQALTQDRPGELDDPAQAELIARWLLNTVRDGERVVRAQLGLPIPDTRYAAREGAGAAER